MIEIQFLEISLYSFVTFVPLIKQRILFKKKELQKRTRMKVEIWDPKHKTNFARERDTSSLPCPLHARALTGDRAREKGAGNRPDVPIHLINRSQELKAGKYALFT